MTTLEILDAGPLTTIQDGVGRTAWRHLGVPVGGAADPWSARLANRLVGNRDTGGLLEMTLAGATVRLRGDAVVALTGTLHAMIDGLPLVRDTARRVGDGATIAVGTGDGLRGYLAVAGGIAAPQVLGSVATDLRSGFGGLEGRALRVGDLLTVGVAGSPVMRRVAGTMRRVAGTTPEAGALRVLPGPHDRRLPVLLGRVWTVAPASDRTGVRLAEAAPDGGETDSLGLPPGAIQLPPDGHPIVLLADRPVTGGYLVPAVVTGADLGRAAQLRPGDPLTLASVSIEEADAALDRAEEELTALEPLDGTEDDELGWIGSHE